MKQYIATIKRANFVTFTTNTTSSRTVNSNHKRSICITNATIPYFVEFLLRTSICNLLQMQHVHTLFNSNYKVQFVSFTTNPKFPYAVLKFSIQIFPWLRIIVKSGWISRVRSFQEQNLQSKDLKESNGFYQLWWPIATISKLPTFNIGARLT